MRKGADQGKIGPPFRRLGSVTELQQGQAGLCGYLWNRFLLRSRLHSSISGSLNIPDLNEYLSGASLMPTTPHAITGEQVPLTMGHEFSGIVEEVGEEILDVKPGDRVVIQPIIYDGTCGACQEGYINCCDGNGEPILFIVILFSFSNKLMRNRFRRSKWYGVPASSRGHLTE